VLVCEGSLCPRKRPDVSGPGLGEAGRYIEVVGGDVIDDGEKDEEEVQCMYSLLSAKLTS
jgi:hypothetical protein